MPVSAPTELVFLKPTVTATTNTTAVSGSAVAIGSLVVVIGGYGGGAVTNVTDTAGNTYTRTVAFVQSSSGVLLAWSITTASITTSTTWTVTSSSNNACNISVQAFTSVAASPLDGSSSAGAATGTTTNSGNATVAGSDNLLIGVSSYDVGALGSFTPAVVSPVWSSFTTDHWFPTSASGSRQFDAHFRNVAASGTYAYAATGPSSTDHSEAIISFKAAAGATGIPDLIMAPPGR